MDEVIYRAFASELEIMPRAKDAEGGDGRTVYGIAVPYGRAMRINAGLTEQFARGAFNSQLKAPHSVKYAREHLARGGALIGRATLLRDDTAGLYAELRVSATPAGDETLELIRDGVLTDLSIGFREGDNRRLSGGTVERARAKLIEIASVLEGAYGKFATVAGVRSAEDDEGGEATTEPVVVIPEEVRAAVAESMRLPALPPI